MSNSCRDTTAALIIIGNEILSGKLRDTNSPFLLEELFSLGVTVKRVHTIPDDLDVVAKVVREASESWDFVLTSGGVGPTHDDVTLPSIARAFGVEMVEHPELMSLLKAHFGEEVNSAARRMATVPEGTHLLWKEGQRYPLLTFKNVYIFPGVPRFLESKFIAIREIFKSRPYHLVEIHTRETEDSLAHHLEATEAAHPSVEIGSYPKFEDSGAHWVLLTLQGKEVQELEAARAYLCGCLDPEKLIRSGKAGFLL